MRKDSVLLPRTCAKFVMATFLSLAVSDEAMASITNLRILYRMYDAPKSIITLTVRVTLTSRVTDDNNINYSNNYCIEYIKHFHHFSYNYRYYDYSTLGLCTIMTLLFART